MQTLWLIVLVVTAGLSAQAQQSTQPTTTTPAAELQTLRERLADWPQLARYRAENAALPPLAPGEKRVVFFGSSTTDNWGHKYGVFFPGKPYLNRGISGQTSPQMLVRFQQDVVALHPVAVVFLGGSNDIAGNTGPATLDMIEDNIRSIVAIAKANGIRVVLASQLPTLEFPWAKGTHPAPTLLALSAWEKEYARAQGLAYVDYYSALAGPDGGPRQGLSIDGLHPSAQGYAVMAPVIQRVLDHVLASTK